MSIKYTLKHKILAMERVKTIWEGDGARPREPAGGAADRPLTNRGGAAAAARTVHRRIAAAPRGAARIVL